ncbi:MAG: septum formation protein Maf [Gammaproteobacteria bacterium]|nr:septum formation protein Maf [Gammaproteobacteria bacterium]
MSAPRLILGSTSPYRRALLERLGVAFEARVPGIDEHPLDGETALELAQRLAREKAEHVARQTDRADAIVIAADQSAALGTTTLGKPGGFAAALEQLQSCQGRTVLFYTATTVLDCSSTTMWHDVDTTEVRFRQRSTEQLQQYLEREQPYDCAGGFKIEGLGISLFEAIETRDPTALIGLPLIWLTGVLAELGLDPLQ